MKSLFGLLILLVGCTKTIRPLIQLEMYSDTQTALYVVQQSGTVEFGGGMDALAGKTTWTGTLTSGQLSKLQSLLHSETMISENQNLTNRYVIEIQNGEEFQHVVLPLTDSSATELYYFLEESTLQRIQSHLDSLPKPSMDVITERKIKGSNR